MKYTEAQLEAQNLEHSLAQHQQREQAIEKQAEIERFRQARLQQEIQQFNQHQYEQQQQAAVQKQHHQQQNTAHGQSELQQSDSDVNLDESVLMGHKAVQKLQAQLEAKVQKELDELTVIANNEYAGGKHTYDYQLVRLSEGQKK